MDDDIGAMLDRLIARQERIVFGLPADDGPRPGLRLADVTGLTLRESAAAAAAAAQTQGHAMSDFAPTAAGTPWAGLVAFCVHERCSCLIYDRDGTEGVIVIGMDTQCPHNPAALP